MSHYDYEDKHDVPVRVLTTEPTKDVKKRTIISDLGKANLKAAKRVKIIPKHRNSSFEYFVLLVGTMGKKIPLEDKNGNTIIYSSIIAAKRQLKSYIDLGKVEIVSQLEVEE